MEEELAELEKSGATETAAKLREKWKEHATSHDTLKAENAAAQKKLQDAEKELAKLKALASSADKSTDERVTKLTAERDEAKALADKHASELESFRLRSALGDKLGISDARVRKRALDVFLAEYRPEGSGFDAKGELQGFDAALEAFKTAEPLFFSQAETAHGGGRAGSDPRASKSTNQGDPTDSADYWAKVYGYAKEVKQ